MKLIASPLQYLQTVMANMSFESIYNEMREKHPNAVLLFRCGDFYEVYNRDAEICAKVLGITKTERRGIFMGGFPYYALDTYLPKLILAGHVVVICATDPTVKEVEKIIPPHKKIVTGVEFRIALHGVVQTTHFELRNDKGFSEQFLAEMRSSFLSRNEDSAIDYIQMFEIEEDESPKC